MYFPGNCKNDPQILYRKQNENRTKRNSKLIIPCLLIAYSAARLNLCESLRSNRAKKVTDDGAVDQGELGFFYLLKQTAV